jgi:hypothetical protein
MFMLRDTICDIFTAYISRSEGTYHSPISHRNRKLNLSQYMVRHSEAWIQPRKCSLMKLEYLRKDNAVRTENTGR